MKDQSAQYAIDSAGKTIVKAIVWPNGDGSNAVGHNLYTPTASFSNPAVNYDKLSGIYLWSVGGDNQPIPGTCWQYLKITDVSQDPDTGNFTQTRDWYWDSQGTPVSYETDTVVVSGDYDSFISNSVN